MNNKSSTFDLLKKVLTQEDEEGRAPDFANCFFNRICQKKCGVDCNNHYTEGPEHWNMIGCMFSDRFACFNTEKDIRDFLIEIITNVDAGLYWNNGRWEAF